MTPREPECIHGHGQTPRGGGIVNEPRGREGIYLSGVGGRVFSPKRPKKGRVNSVFMRFSITIFPGRVSDFGLKGGGGSRFSP